tara:strand:- start:698 stop:1819 length:1122 start_codon:yes stop_codon:yes gene_type:complete
MKILIVIGPFSSFSDESYGGVEKLWLTMGKKFKELGSEVIFVSKKTKKNSENKLVDGILFKRIGGYSATKNRWRRLVLDFLYTIKAALILPKDTDIVVTNTFWSPIIFPLFVSKQSKIYVDVARMPKGQMFLYKHAARLRVNTEAVKKNIKKEVTKSLAKKIKVIPPSLPFKTPININIKNKKLLIVYLGRIHKEKGIEIFINALEKINLQKWKVRIIGPWKIEEGGSGKDYKNILLKKINNKSVTIENPVSAKKIFKIYKDTSIFVYPSLAKYETFGLSVAEFMSYGAVPVVSGLDCFKDFIYHNINGLVFDHKLINSTALLASCLKTLIANKKLRLRMANQAMKINKTHSIETIARAFLSDFKHLKNEKKN